MQRSIVPKEKQREYRRRYYKKYGLTSSKITKEWRKNNPEKAKIAFKRDNTSLSGRFKAIRSNARKRNMLFTITKEDLREFWQKPCFFCGKNIDNIQIDRIDNKKGYIEGNIRSCCKWCNSMKSNNEDKEFIEQVRRIHYKTKHLYSSYVL